MSGTKYTVPLGVDSENLINPLNETISTLEKVETTAKDAGKELQEGFNKGSKAADSLEEKIKPIQKGLEAVKVLGKQAGKELADAFNERNIDPSKLERAVAAFQNKLQGLTAKVDVDINPAKLAIFEKQLQGAKNEVQELEIAMNIAKEVMASLDPNSEEFQQLAEAITYTETALGEFANNVDVVTTKQKSLKGELREIKAELQRMELAGEAGSQRFIELSLRAGELEDQIGDTNAQIKILASDTATFDGLISGATGLVGAFTAAQGASALFGGENEELEKVLLKVNAAMAILQGLQAVAETLNKDSAFSVVFLRSAKVANTAATVADTAATAANTAVTAAAIIATEAQAAADAAETITSEAATAANTAQAAANTAVATTAAAATVATEAQAAANAQLATGEAAAATGAAANATAQGAQTVAMGGATIAANVLGFALKAIGIGLILTAIAALVEYWDELTDAMKTLLPSGTSVGKMFDNIKSYAFGVGNAIIQYIITPFKAANLAATGDFEGAWQAIKKGYDVIGNFKEGKLTQDARNQEKYRNEQEAADLKAQKRELERRKNRGQDVYKEEQALYKREIALKKKTREDTEEVQKEMEDAQDKRYADNAKKAEAARKKAEADAKKAAEKAKADAKKAAEEAKKQAELVLKYTDEINKLRISSIKDSYEQEREAIKVEAENKIRDLAKDDAKTAAAKAKQAELILAINTDANNKLKEAEKKHNEEVAALRLEGAKMLQDLSKDSKEKELKLLEIENEQAVAEINKKFENETALKGELLAKQAEYLEQQRKEVAIKYGEKEIEQNLEKATAILELSRNVNTESEKQEEQHQLALLEIKKQAAEASVKNLIDNGKDENSAEVLNAKLKVKQIQDAIDEQAKKGKKFDMMEWLGIGTGWSKEDAANIKQAASDLLNNISQITDGLIEQYQRQIDKKQEVIDQYNGEIDDLEQQLDKEKELRDNGYANNVEVIEKELETKKAQRDEEIRQQKEMVKKQEEIKKAQMAVDTAVQLVNMITSATNIFNSLSGIPFIGVPLAIALIGTMFGAFAMAKAKAFQSIKSGQQYEGGGWIDGELHSQGGKKYYSPDGEVRELEKDEFVVRRKQAKKYAPLLEAINSGNFDNLTFSDLGTMGLFAALGITFENGEVGNAVEEGKELEAVAAQVNVITGGKSHDFSKMEGDIAYLAKRKREEAETWEDDKYYYKKVGSKITKIKK